MNWYKSLPPFVQATIERMVRAGIASVVAAYVGGDLLLNNINIHTFSQVATLFVAGAVTALLLALGVQVGTKGKGPALTSAENLTGAKPAHRLAEDGRTALALLLAVLGVFTALLLTVALFAAPAQANRDTNWPCASCFRIR